MTLSPKQMRSFAESNARINIWEGSVRSGKTFVSLLRFLDEVKDGPDGTYAIICKTYELYKKNLNDIIFDFLRVNAKYYAGKRELHLFGKTVFITGADDERAEGKIRGSTFCAAYVDELSMIPKSVFMMLISRCAMGGAKIFATTNPDSPFHWLKTEFLTNNPDVKSWQFRLDDNPVLKQGEKDYLIRQYKGLWYQRFIEGLWVQAEGSIYDTFDSNLHVIDYGPKQPRECIIGVDYGTTNPCAFVSVAINTGAFPNLWIEDEYFYDSKIHQRQKTDSEYAADLMRFIKDKPVKAIYIDPSAASFKLELQRQGVTNLCDAENEVIDGIRFVSKLINEGTLKICRNCTNLLKEMQSYVWDPKCLKTGVDKPLKEHDHACITGDSMVLTDKGFCRIDEIVGTEGYIASLNNEKVTFEKYENVSLTRENTEVYELELEGGITIRATADHKFLTDTGWKQLKDLIHSDIVFTWNTNIFSNQNFT